MDDSATILELEYSWPAWAPSVAVLMMPSQFKTPTRTFGYVGCAACKRISSSPSSKCSVSGDIAVSLRCPFCGHCADSHLHAITSLGTRVNMLETARELLIYSEGIDLRYEACRKASFVEGKQSIERKTLDKALVFLTEYGSSLDHFRSARRRIEGIAKLSPKTTEALMSYVDKHYWASSASGFLLMASCLVIDQTAYSLGIKELISRVNPSDKLSIKRSYEADTRNPPGNFNRLVKQRVGYDMHGFLYGLYSGMPLPSRLSEIRKLWNECKHRDAVRIPPMIAFHSYEIAVLYILGLHLASCYRWSETNNVSS